jgi:hypothetical protein
LNVIPIQHQKWFDFDPHMDVHIGDIVGVQAPKIAQRNGELFWVAKVRELQNVAREDGEFLGYEGTVKIRVSPFGHIN